MILHIDMDAFYAAVELRDDPDLRGKPVVVGGSPRGRGVISAASYEARKFGVHSAMPSSQALRLCPNIVFVKPRMDYYADISKQIREIFFDFTSLVEPISLDEAFLDVRGCAGLFGDSVSIARQIKSRIKSETNLVASAGVAPNKFLAKVASDLEKPDGLTVVDPDAVQEFLDPLPISRIWGIGKVTERKFKTMGVQTVAQLRQIPEASLQAKFGINSSHFWKLSRGIDSRQVVPDRDAKTISHESTFARDIYDVGALSAWTLELTDQVALRMRRYDIVGKTVNLKIRFNDFQTITRANSLTEATNSTNVLADIANTLLERTLTRGGKPNFDRGIRLLGVGVSNLKSPQQFVQKTLFDHEDREKQNRFDQMSDEIRDRFGHSSLRRGTSLEHEIRHRPDPRVDE